MFSLLVVLSFDSFDFPLIGGMIIQIMRVLLWHFNRKCLAELYYS